MGALTYLVTWAGYSVFALGIANVRGCNVTWTAISWPGRFSGCHPDSGGSGGGAPSKPIVRTSDTSPGIAPGQPGYETTGGAGRSPVPISR